MQSCGAPRKDMGFAADMLSSDTDSCSSSDGAPITPEERHYCSLSPKKFRKLSYFPFSDNESELAQEISRSQTSHDCNLSALQLVKIPSNIPLEVLTHLSISQNQLSSLPADMFTGGRCQQLRQLDVNSNALASLPSELFYLPNLEVLMLNHNSLETLPDVKPSRTRTILPSLQRIGLEFNALRSFPKFIFEHCSQLTEVLLGNNQPMLGHYVPLVKLERCPAALQWQQGSRKNPVVLKLDNRPRFLQQVAEEDWANKFPWLSLDLHKIYPDKVLDFLFLGSMRTAQTPTVYRDCDIHYVLTVGRDLEVTIEEGMKHKVLPIDDFPGENIATLFSEAFGFIDEARASKSGVLIHCFAGLSRSVTIAAAYIMQAKRLSYVDAMKIIRAARPAAQPNDGFVTCLQINENRLMNGLFSC